MMRSPVAGRTGRAAAAVALLLAACSSSPGDPGTVGCRINEGSVQRCFELRGLSGDDARLYFLQECRDGNGVMVDACPAENQLGYCEYLTPPPDPDARPSNMPVRYTFRERRVFAYAVPGGLSELGATGAPECRGDGTWRAAPAQ